MARADAAIGKTVVSSAMIDRVAQRLGRRVYEVPVGFKWFVAGLFDGSCCFGGEESAGASFLRLDGSVFVPDGSGGLTSPLGLDFGPDHALYVGGVTIGAAIGGAG